MIDMSLYDALDEQAKTDAQKYVYDFVKNMSAFFEPGFDLKEYAQSLYDLLNYEKYNDYKIKSGRCDKVLYKYIATGEFRPKFSDSYREAIEYIRPRVSKIYDTEVFNARKNDDTSSMFYGYYINQTDKISMATEILTQAVKEGITDEELNHFIVDYINLDRTKQLSALKKEVRRAEADSYKYRKELSYDDIKKLLIVGAIIFGMCWISKATYESKQNKQKQSNKPKYSYSVKTTSSTQEDYYSIYDLDSNEFTIGDDQVAKL